MIRLSVIIVNYRSACLVCECLKSLCTEVQKVGGQVIVVDNNSEDGSVENLSETIKCQGWESWVTLLPQDYNAGFAGGNNAALRYLLKKNNKFTDYAMLLNPDTVVHPGALERLICFMDELLKVGIVGAQLENKHKNPESSARRYPSVWSELDGGARLGILTSLLKNYQVSLPLMDWPHRCDWVSGAAMVIRRQVFEQIGLMDEGFFLYFEELDFCQRASNEGWQIWLVPSARVTHYEGSVTGIKIARSRRGRYWYDSRRRYFIKHHGVTRLLFADLLWGIGRLSLVVRSKLKLGGGISDDPLHFFKDLVLGDILALLEGDTSVSLCQCNPKKRIS